MIEQSEQPEYDRDGIAWYPTESLYAAPDVVPQQSPTADLSDLRGAIERGERVHWHVDETGFSPDNSFAGQRRLNCDTVVIAPELLRKDRADDEEDS